MGEAIIARRGGGGLSKSKIIAAIENKGGTIEAPKKVEEIVASIENVRQWETDFGTNMPISSALITDVLNDFPDNYFGEYTSHSNNGDYSFLPKGGFLYKITVTTSTGLVYRRKYDKFKNLLETITFNAVPGDISRVHQFQNGFTIRHKPSAVFFRVYDWNGNFLFQTANVGSNSAWGQQCNVEGFTIDKYVYDELASSIDIRNRNGSQLLRISPGNSSLEKGVIATWLGDYCGAYMGENKMGLFYSIDNGASWVDGVLYTGTTQTQIARNWAKRAFAMACFLGGCSYHRGGN